MISPASLRNGNMASADVASADVAPADVASAGVWPGYPTRPGYLMWVCGIGSMNARLTCHIHIHLASWNCD